MCEYLARSLPKNPGDLTRPYDHRRPVSRAFFHDDRLCEIVDNERRSVRGHYPWDLPCGCKWRGETSRGVRVLPYPFPLSLTYGTLSATTVLSYQEKSTMPEPPTSNNTTWVHYPCPVINQGSLIAILVHPVSNYLAFCAPVFFFYQIIPPLLPRRVAPARHHLVAPCPRLHASLNNWRVICANDRKYCQLLTIGVSDVKQRTFTS